MATPFIAQIVMFGGSFNPRGWAFCSGQIMAIAQNTALFSLLGTTYGGNGQTTFGLPDLRGRVPIHAGQGPGTSNYTPGESSGTENVTLTTGQMPAHNHPATLNASSNPTSDSSPAGNFLADGNSYTNTTNAQMNAGAITVGLAGNNQPVSILQPFLVINFIIALEGTFPSRN